MTNSPESVIADNISYLRGRVAATCQQHGRRADEIRLIAVTKQQQPRVLTDLADCQVIDWGENRPDHADLMRAYADQAVSLNPRWHFIGRLQSRQLKRIVPWADTIHSVAKADHLAAIDRLATAHHKTQNIFIQVNMSDEPQKDGVARDHLEQLIDQARACDNIACCGLMTMAAQRHEVGDDAVLASFTGLAEAAQRYGLTRLSMGMSGDFDLALAAGATELRLGTVCFAQRS